ncbi:shikimate dehydrogenase [Thorsellia kenyensis]|uniref:Shikimate dehydrogenase (NADP(+)) n=1 Tax=Thorsellia kenyensis TaxID=1549888 RepID=A0ABV6C6T5_9GAMM
MPQTPPFFLVLGNPIEHSKSPLIHSLFAKQTGIEHVYDKALVPLEHFDDFTLNFFKQAGKGANVTVPFKEQAFRLVDDHTNSALAAGAVNTIIKTKEGKLLGDNTDGYGLLCDLNEKKWIAEGSRILLLGAGGAAKGTILPLLEYNTKVSIFNRTYQKAIEMVERFKGSTYYQSDFGELNVLSLEDLTAEQSAFDIIINATASSLSSEVLKLPGNVFNSQTAFYDMFYAKTDTAFLAYYRDKGCNHLADGLGMLVYQAALAFKAWHGVMPDAKQVLAQVKNVL